MKLTTKVSALGLGSWRCEVLNAARKCIAWATTPPEWQITRSQAKRFAKEMAVVCKNMPPGEYDITTSGLQPLFTQDAVWSGKLGSASIPTETEGQC